MHKCSLSFFKLFSGTVCVNLGNTAPLRNCKMLGWITAMSPFRTLEDHNKIARQPVITETVPIDPFGATKPLLPVLIKWKDETSWQLKISVSIDSWEKFEKNRDLWKLHLRWKQIPLFCRLVYFMIWWELFYIPTLLAFPLHIHKRIISMK